MILKTSLTMATFTGNGIFDDLTIASASRCSRIPRSQVPKEFHRAVNRAGKSSFESSGIVLLKDPSMDDPRIEYSIARGLPLRDSRLC